MTRIVILMSLLISQVSFAAKVAPIVTKASAKTTRKGVPHVPKAISVSRASFSVTVPKGWGYAHNEELSPEIYKKTPFGSLTVSSQQEISKRSSSLTIHDPVQSAPSLEKLKQLYPQAVMTDQKWNGVSWKVIQYEETRPDREGIYWYGIAPVGKNQIYFRAVVSRKAKGKDEPILLAIMKSIKVKS